MGAPIDMQQFKQLIRQELPAIIQQDVDLRRFIIQLSREQYADKQETESRFDRMLEELRRDRETNERRWRENAQQWRENERRWQENQQQLRELQQQLREHLAAEEQRWREHLAAEEQRWREHQEAEAKKWEESQRKWEENQKKWEENQARLDATWKAIQNTDRRIDRTLGALGARWGLYSEQSFRNALKGILEESFGVQVLNVTEYDHAGEVFGRPDQIELDIIIKNGQLIICEISSSVSRAEMYTFDKKARFYERLHQRAAERKLVISPMVEERAQQLAEELGIEVYTHAEDVPPIDH